MHPHGKRWVEEFRAEIVSDHRQIIDARARRAGGPWCFDHALERTRRFYRDRIGGFAACLSVTETEREELLRLVERLGTAAFPFKT